MDINGRDYPVEMTSSYSICAHLWIVHQSVGWEKEQSKIKHMIISKY